MHTFEGPYLVNGSDDNVLSKTTNYWSLEQTNLAGQVRTEINCLPVENQEHQEYLEKLAFETLNKRPKTQFIENPLAASGGSLLNPGVLGPGGNFGSFTVGYPTLSICA